MGHDGAQRGVALAVKWTREQELGITTTGCSVLVSAAAGSGKTAVLAERCAYLVCDCPDPCDVDELLVVTFTDAAAAEMRSRIQRALRQRLETTSDPRLQRQVALVERMNVSTLHGFCSRLIRQHFHLLGLDPSFSVLDGDEAHLLQLEVARTLFDERYEKDQDGLFQAFVDAYGDGNDERLIQQVIQTSATLNSLTDAGGWCDASLARIDEAIEGPLEQSALGKALHETILQRLREVWVLCRDAMKFMTESGQFPQYVEVLKQHDRIIRHWADVLKSDGIDAMAGEVDVHYDKLPSVKSDVPGKEQAKKRMDALRKAVGKEGALRQLLRFTPQQWCDGLIAIRPHAELFLDLVRAFEHKYAREKQEMRAIDFSDLERHALRLLCDPDKSEPAPSRVARLLHGQFKHVLVDEYQDINAVQDTILKLVSRECVMGHNGTCGNLFSVGDVKQSIYRFRLAEPKRFLQRADQFRAGGPSGGCVIDLQANFRSRATLLDAINAVFHLLMVDKATTEVVYDESHLLRAGASYPDGDGQSCFTGAPIEMHVLPQPGVGSAGNYDGDETNGDPDAEPDRTEREALLIARRIREMLGRDSGTPMCVMEKGSDGAMSPRAIQYRDIVILLRSMQYKAEQFADILRQSGIPVHSESSTGYFESMEVRDMLALLHVLDNQQQDIPLAAVLRSPIANLPDPDDSLARIRLAYQRGDELVPFHQAVVRYANEHDDDLAARLRDVLRQINDWRDMAQRRPLAELIWTIYDATGYLAFCSGLPDGHQRVANMIDLHERARQFGTFQRQGLARFLAFLDQLREQADLGQPSIAGAGENVVRIMSIHRSKGLEFPVVFVPDLGKRINTTDCNRSILVDREAYLGLMVPDERLRAKYPSLAWTLVSASLLRQSLAEELRVLYVAMTRAKEHLILIGTARPETVEGWRDRWGTFTGERFSPDVVMSARTLLDWLGPVAVASGRGGAERIRIYQYTQEELDQWPTPDSLRPRLGDHQVALAQLKALDPAPAMPEDAQRAIDRITRPYAFQPFTHVRAAEAVSTLSKSGRAVPLTPTGPSTGRTTTTTTTTIRLDRRLSLPRCVATDLKPAPTEIGSATHLVLQHLDFARPCDPDDIRAQIESLVDRCLISKPQARMVDVEAICWFLGTKIGRTVQHRAAEVLRELPVYFPMPPPNASDLPASTDPMDRVMVRSRVDLLVPTRRGLEVVDYKTDHVTAEQVNERAEFYRQQIELYRMGLSAALQRDVVGGYLIFLSPRVVWPSDGA